MKIYISGKISGCELKQAKRKFAAAEQELQRLGHDVANPCKIKPFWGLDYWACYMISDIIQLVQCDVVFFLNDWEYSKGARIEHKIARWLGLDIWKESTFRR